MKIKRWSILLSAFLLLFGLVPPAFSEAPNPQSKAEARLKLRLKRTLPKRGLSLNCVQLEPEEGPPLCFQFAVREIHGGDCPGDPSTAPIIDRYRVGKNDGKIRRWDPINDEWKSK